MRSHTHIKRKYLLYRQDLSITSNQLEFDINGAIIAIFLLDYNR